jgi:lipopolysaccharide export system permease protein
VNLIDRYIIGAVVAGVLLVLAVIVALSSFLLFVGQFDNIGVGSYALGDALLYVLLKAPQQAYEIFPIATLIGAMLGLGGLATHSELIVMRAAGVTTWRLAAAVAMAGVLLALMAAGLGEVLAPPAEQYAVSSKAIRMHSRLAFTRNGTWLRNGDMFINVGNLETQADLGQLSIYSFGDDGRLELAATAGRALFRDGSWEVFGYRESRMHADGSITISDQQSRSWSEGMDPELMNLIAQDPDALGMAGLIDYIDYLQTNALDDSNFQVALWSRVSTLVAVLFMTLLALPFNFGGLRSAGQGQRVFLGVLIGAGFFLFDRTFGNTGQVYGLHPLVTAWLPTLTLVAITVFMVRRVR